MDLSIPQLSRLRAFVAVAQNLSFKRAADGLHVTQSALSHHVRHLEDELGVSLLKRLHRRVELTQAGEQLLEDCSRGFESLSAGLKRLRPTEGVPLTVSVAPYFSARWLTPRLGALWARHPDLKLQLRHAYEPADLLHSSVDAGISWGHGNWPDVDATLVLSGRLIAICSPDLLREMPRTPTPGDLLKFRLLYEFDAAHWHAWFANAGISIRRRLTTVQVDDSHALRRSVLDSYGVGLFFCGLIEEDLASGALKAPFNVSVDPGSAYYFVTPGRGRPHPHLQLFRSWLMGEIASSGRDR